MNFTGGGGGPSRSAVAQAFGKDISIRPVRFLWKLCKDLCKNFPPIPSNKVQLICVAGFYGMENHDVDNHNYITHAYEIFYML